MFRKILRVLLKSVLGLFLIVLVYLAAALSLGAIGVNEEYKRCDKDAVEIYLVSNGVHSDLLLPFKNNIQDWSVLVSPSHCKAALKSPEYVAFGWGDKGFYLETPQWSDLKFRTAFNALFYLGSSAMHVSFYEQPKETASCRKICMSKESYRKLVDYISCSFEKEIVEKTKPIPGAAYGYYDAFYEARGRYSLFYTCNTWTNNALKAAGLRACFWTPFDWPVLNRY